MGLGDWTQYIFNSSTLTISLNITTPIVGNGSLKVVHSSAVNNAMNMHLTSLSKAFTKGRIRTILRMSVRPQAARGEGGGILFMQSKLDLTSNDGNGSFYSFRLGAGASGSPGTQKWQLHKNSSTTNLRVLGTVIDEATTETVVDGDYWPMQVEWNVDIPNLGGTRITCAKGTKNSTDFGTLATIIDYLDVTSPFTTTLGEGIFDCTPDTGFSTHTTEFDETTIYELQ